ncbi:uncharacterized protein LOC144920363 [Branchiostoma floridae x Branchiostoma belcheri]
MTLKDFELQEGEPGISVRGRLKKNIAYWERCGAPEFILDTIREGYKLPFKELPNSRLLHNNASAKNNFEFVSSAVSELLQLGCIQEVSKCPFICNPLSVAIQSSGKKRLILDLRYVNLFLFKHKFKCEDLRLAAKEFRRNEFMFTFDLKSGYHHIDIFQGHRKYLGFAWKFDGKTRYFVFCVLPFGLSTAPYIFTKLLKPIVTKWRSEGISIFVYLDDGLGKGRGLDNTRLIAKHVCTDIVKFGLVPNPGKCVWEPSQVVTWLGTIINLMEFKFFATDRRMTKLYAALTEIIEDFKQEIYCFPVKKIASIVGQIISLELCIGSVVRIMTRYLYFMIETRSSWYCNVTLDHQAIREVIFWFEHLRIANGFPIASEFEAARIVYSDASAEGYGGYVVNWEKSFVQGTWNDLECTQSSTWRELRAIFLVLSGLKEELARKHVKWYCDNTAAVKIVKVGSVKRYLQDIALDIFNVCNEYNIVLDATWIPRTKNDKADALSRFFDVDDYEIDPPVFHYLNRKFGPHQVDRFANHLNKKLERFNSKSWCPSSEGIDAFSFDWAGQNNWLHPPVRMIPRVIKHMQDCKAFGTLIVPLWKSASFWTMLCKDGVHFDTFVHDFVDLRVYKNLFRKGMSKNTLFGNKLVKFRVLALRISFENPRDWKKILCSSVRRSCQACLI